MHPLREASAAIGIVLKSVADVNPIFMPTTDKSATLLELLENRAQMD